MKTGPQLCSGHVMHRRLRPVDHKFVYPVFYVQLPLRQLEQARCAVFSLNRFNLLSVHEADHGARDGSPLLPWISALLAEHGLPHDGEIVLQTFPRVLGYVFNPVSFWYCHDRAGALIAVLAEVNNTFGGHHSYLLHDHGEPLRDRQVLHAPKAFHVSPFNRIEGAYRFQFRQGAQRQLARIDYEDAEGPLLLTSISGTPQPWGTRALLLQCLKMPALTLGILLRIHWQALQLWLKGVPFLGAHPSPSPIQESQK